MMHEDIRKIMLKYRGKRLTRGQSIKIYCKEICCCGDMKSWVDCTLIHCPLWAFRKGKEIVLDNSLQNKKTNEKPQHSAISEAKNTKFEEGVSHETED